VNKAIIISIIIIVIIGLGVVISFSMNKLKDQNILDKDVRVDEAVLGNKSGIKETKVGRNLSVELKESVGLKSP